MIWLHCTALMSPGNTVCDFVGYRKCISQFQILVDQASADRDLLFSEFCKSVSYVIAVIVKRVFVAENRNKILKIVSTIERVSLTKIIKLLKIIYCRCECVNILAYICMLTSAFRVGWPSAVLINLFLTYACSLNGKNFWWPFSRHDIA